MSLTATTVVTFTNLEESLSASLSIALDSKKILEYYQTQKTTFDIGDAVFLRVISGSDDYTVEASQGTITKLATDILYEVSEDVSFTNTKVASLSSLPAGSPPSVTYEWLGNNGGTALFNNKTITIPEPVVGILRCIYKVSGDRWKLVASPIKDDATVLVVAIQGDTTASLTVSYTNEDSSTPVPVEIKVSDFCSDEVLEDVTIWVDGDEIGRTNAEGLIYVGMFTPGSTHTLLMTKSGYIDSNVDILYNDSFTIPAAT